MIDKIKALFAVFKTGEMVANPLAWKKKQITGGLIAGFLGAVVALSKAFGYDIPLDDDQLLQIGGAVIAVFGLFNGAATVVSTTSLGLSPREDGKTDAPVAVDSASVHVMPAVPASAPAALHPSNHTETGAWIAEPAEPGRTSFTGGA